MHGNQAIYESFFSGTAPVRLNYGGKPVPMNAGWTSETVSQGDSTLERRVCSLPDGLLRITLEIRSYADFPAIEWGIILENPGQYTSEMVDDVDIANLHFLFNPAITPFFVEMAGSNEQLNDFRFLRTQMFHRARRDLKCQGGRSSSCMMPYFNMLLENCGYLLAIGWSGQWNASAWRENDEGYVDFRAGMEDCAFVVCPGERFELPRMLMLGWQGREEDSYNLYRRFALRHIVPQVDGHPIQMPNCLSAWGGDGAKSLVEKIDVIQRHNLSAECFWVDAGWYGDENSVDVTQDRYNGCWYIYAGVNDWRPNPLIYPDGMAPVARRCEEAGIGYLLWYEPERARSTASRVHAHPDWYIGECRPDSDLQLDLGNEEALNWLIERLSEDIANYHLRVLRIDFNYSPLPFWRSADAPNRRGVHEIRYNRGLYRLWDTLLSRFPGLIIDNCASGGRRLDYEALRRSVPFFRTDYACFPDALDEGFQLHSYALNHYLPLNATSMAGPTDASDEALARATYALRSRLGSCITIGTPEDGAPEAIYEWYRTMFQQTARIRKYTVGDFYPLTGCSDSPRDWMAWQMHLTSKDEGMIMAFRRSESPLCAADFELRGVDPSRNYIVEDLDTGNCQSVPGSVLQNGLHVQLPEKQSSAVIFYRAE